MQWLYRSHRFLMEVAGVVALSGGMWWRLEPLAGITIVAAYLIVRANSGTRGGQ